jgi:protein-S-isoprenylcysteine O-methyltransferase Ste14
MQSDQPFRLIALALLALLVPIGAWFRIRSQSTGEKLDRRREGWFILLTLRPVGLLHAAGVIAYVINPGWMAWSQFALPIRLRWTGLPLGLFAVALVFWTFHNLGKNLTDTVVTRKEHTLVTTGPYRWVRHPFYVAFAALVAANTLLTANGYVGLSGAAVLALLVHRTRTEEQHLLARFGDAYRRYMHRTGRFFPRLATNDSSPPPRFP